MSFKDNEPVGSFFMPVKNVLSLFNGISALHLALDRAGIEINTCYYAEIDKYANKITEQHYPNDVALGDVTKWREWDIDWASIDLVGAGFPCQAWSVAGKQLGDKDERGMLFWTTLEIIAHVLKHNPEAKFLMENVKMKKDFEQYITHHTEQALGRVEKTLINSALVSAQNRQRYYWTNFEVKQPDDKGILLRDILEDGDNERAKSQTILATIYKENVKSMVQRGKLGLIAKAGNVNPSGRGMNGNVYHVDAKSPTLTTNKGEGIKITGGAIRGRYLVDGKRQDHKMKTAGLTEQRLEVRGDGKTNTLTTVQKDNVVVYRPCELKPNNKPSEVGLWNIATATDIKGHEQRKRVYSVDGKAPTLQTCGGGNHEPKIYYPELKYRKLTPIECERLQTFPDNWTDCVSNTQRYKSLGNAWTVDVIAHIFKCMQRVEG